VGVVVGRLWLRAMRQLCSKNKVLPGFIESTAIIIITYVPNTTESNSVIKGEEMVDDDTQNLLSNETAKRE